MTGDGDRVVGTADLPPTGDTARDIGYRLVGGPFWTYETLSGPRYHVQAGPAVVGRLWAVDDRSIDELAASVS